MHRLKHIELLVCDWSGVISDDRRAVHETNSRMMRHFELEPLPYESWLPTTTASPREAFAKRGIVLPDDGLFTLYQSIYPKVVAEGIAPIMYGDVSRFLKAVLPRPIVIVSAHPQSFLESEAEVYGIRDRLYQLRGSIPHKATAITEVIRELNVPRERVAYLGDMVSDVASAQEASVLAIAVASGYHERSVLAELEPDILVDSLTELVPHF